MHTNFSTFVYTIREIILAPTDNYFVVCSSSVAPVKLTSIDVQDDALAESCWLLTEDTKSGCCHCHYLLCGCCRRLEIPKISLVTAVITIFSAAYSGTPGNCYVGKPYPCQNLTYPVKRGSNDTMEAAAGNGRPTNHFSWAAEEQRWRWVCSVWSERWCIDVGRSTQWTKILLMNNNNAGGWRGVLTSID